MAKNGREGLDKLTDPTGWADGVPPFLFALVDMAMPEMDGCEMTRRASASRQILRYPVSLVALAASATR